MKIIEFESHEVRTLQWDGAPCWLSPEISVALGHKDRYYISTMMRGQWSGDISEPHDFMVLSGSKLRDFKQLNGATLQNTGTHLSKVIVLRETGVFKVLQLCRLPAGKRLRKVLAEQVLPQIARDGSYSPDRTVEQGQIVDAKERPKHVVIRELMGTLKDLGVTDGLDKLAIRAAELETGMTAAELFNASPSPSNIIDVVEPQPALMASPLRTATELGAKLGVSAAMVGRASNEIGMRDGGPGVSFANETLQPSGRIVPMRYFDRDAQRMVESRLRTRGLLAKPEKPKN